jgi:pimeloyl-ACP methyl ester carboxylesterase
MTTRRRTAILGCVLAAACTAAASAPAASYRVTLEAPGQPAIGVHVEEAGAGPPLVLIHGLGASTFTWRHVMPALARRHRVIAIDLPGCGRSDKPRDAAYSAARQAALVAAFLRKTGLRYVTLIGHSFGGTVALLTALELNGEQDRIARLVVIDAPALKQDFGDTAELLRTPGLPYAAISVAPPELMARMLLRYVSAPGRDIPEEDVRGYALPFYAHGARLAFLATAQSILAANVPAMGARYRDIRQPTLLVWCRRDRIVPLATGRKLARRLPNARLEILKACNHLPQDEVPLTLLGKLEAFLTP